MSSESILGLESNNAEAPEQTSGESNVDVRLNTLRETVLQLLEEVESLAISRPVDIKRGARFSDEVRQFEVSLIRTALGRTSGSQTRAARLLGLKPTTLNAKIKRYGTDPTQVERPRDDPFQSLFTAILTCGGRSLQQTDSLQWNWRRRTATADGCASSDCRMRGPGFCSR